MQMRVADLEALLARLAFAGEIKRQQQFCVQDPDGYLLRFKL